MDELHTALRKTAEGEADAFETIVAALEPALCAYLSTIIRDPDLLDDVVQETFLKAMENAASFRGDASVKTWTFTIGRNVAFRYLAKESRHDELSLGQLGVQAGWGEHSDPETITSLNQQREILHLALEELPIEAREIIVLRDIEGHSGLETAEILGVTVSAMKTRLHRSRLKLLAEIDKRLRHG